MKNTKMLLMSLFFLTGCTLFSQSTTREFWHRVDQGKIPAIGQSDILPGQALTYELDINALESHLNLAPFEGFGAGIEMELPTPNGLFKRFQVVDSPLMEEALAQKYPDIRHFYGRGITNPTDSLRITLTQRGFHAMILSDEGTVFIDPYQRNDRTNHWVYAKKDYFRETDFFCDFFEGMESLVGLNNPVGNELLTYRVAIAATGEYTAFHGGTVPLGMAAINVALARVTGIYEREVSIRMILVANNDLIVFTNSSTDPYSNFDGIAMLGQNQSTLDSIIGNANYDIGHVFSTGGGGVAYLGVPCKTGLKAGGVTGLSQPIGDAFYVDYVAHEMGHQWGANHTFNGSTGACAGLNRNELTAYEPGSASTIMGYAGICGSENLQTNSDDFFHGVSFDEIVDYSRNWDGYTCSVVTATGNNAPVVNAGDDYTIPAQTCFMMTGSAVDPNSDPGLTYCWEQFDLGTASPPDIDDGSRPIFRSFDPVSSPSRTFPKLDDILNNTETYGESLPTTDRILTFRLTVRDNQPSGGGVDFDTAVITVDSGAGPFRISSPNAAVTWTGNTKEPIAWNIANTDQAPVSCSQVDIFLSTDGGFTFDQTVALAVPNTGSANIFVPNIDTTTARLKVMATDNIFFDISDADFTVQSSSFICVTSWEQWRALTDTTYFDNNGNGIVDILELLTCLVP